MKFVVTLFNARGGSRGEPDSPSYFGQKRKKLHNEEKPAGQARQHYPPSLAQGGAQGLGPPLTAFAIKNWGAFSTADYDRKIKASKHFVRITHYIKDCFG